MTLITAVAFLLAVRMNAIVVAVLGIAGGFLTPVLLSTGQDNPLGLFGYIALLDMGPVAVAQRQRWNVLPILGAIGTALMQIAWVAAFFVPEKYFTGNKVLLFMAVFTGFQVLFLTAAAWATRTRRASRELFVCAIGLGAIAMFSAFYLLSFPTVADRPASVHLSVRHRFWFARADADRRQGCSSSSRGRTCGIYFSRRVDRKLPNDWSSLYCTGVLFCLHVVSHGRSARASTPA